MESRQGTRGFTLVEMVAVISVSAVIMGLAIGLLHTLLRAKRAAQRQSAHRATIARLADGFRRDVHVAGDLRTDDPSFLCQLELAADDDVRYEFNPPQLSRTHYTKGQVRSRETYALPPGTIVKIEPPGPEDRGRVRLVITPPAEPSAGPKMKRLAIDALLAKDRRYRRRPGG